jgi:hypothetical protein
MKQPHETPLRWTLEARLFFIFLVIFSSDESELYGGAIFLVMNRVV